ncbi:hypothetical protein J4573_31410 [Actinomadura barringtoniae]|uniref:Ig-like domain repeat protein n=1 Tax=Actinomadura barringtoniae TaxID=1427535 RepID=A0A939PFC2_9ACTN|nr:hypothetical protein [Actinomadura barringtoniae]MBO2451635.1 hypothetical protein [Actinomadura barringtoniae]
MRTAAVLAAGIIVSGGAVVGSAGPALAGDSSLKVLLPVAVAGKRGLFEAYCGDGSKTATVSSKAFPTQHLAHAGEPLDIFYPLINLVNPGRYTVFLRCEKGTTVATRFKVIRATGLRPGTPPTLIIEPNRVKPGGKVSLTVINSRLSSGTVTSPGFTGSVALASAGKSKLSGTATAASAPGTYTVTARLGSNARIAATAASLLGPTITGKITVLKPGGGGAKPGGTGVHHAKRPGVCRTRSAPSAC